MKTILAVDDFAPIRPRATFTPQDAGYKASAAVDGNHALHPPQLLAIVQKVIG